MSSDGGALLTLPVAAMIPAPWKQATREVHRDEVEWRAGQVKNAGELDNVGIVVWPVEALGMTPGEAEAVADDQLAEATRMLKALERAEAPSQFIERFHDHVEYMQWQTRGSEGRQGATGPPKYVIVNGTHRWFVALKSNVTTLRVFLVVPENRESYLRGHSGRTTGGSTPAEPAELGVAHNNDASRGGGLVDLGVAETCVPLSDAEVCSNKVKGPGVGAIYNYLSHVVTRTSPADRVFTLQSWLVANWSAAREKRRRISYEKS